MSKVEIKVKFETITPLWTGDAWGENSTIRPSSIIGSLRFWFEVYNKICKNEDFKGNNNGIPNEDLEEEFSFLQNKLQVKEARYLVTPGSIIPEGLDSKNYKLKKGKFIKQG